MRQVFEDFDARVREINVYFEFLEGANSLDSDRPEIVDTPAVRLINPDLNKIFKANGFLLVYNLVESCIHNALIYMYNEVQLQSLPYKDISDEFQKIWVDAYYKQSFNATANWNTGKSVAKSMINHVINESPLEFGTKSLKISGNLDARKIRELFSEHGIPLENTNSARGQHLQIVKDKRNALAHGSISFTECGREHTHGDLKNYKDDTIEYLRLILEEIKKFIEEKKFQRPIRNG